VEDTSTRWASINWEEKAERLRASAQDEINAVESVSPLTTVSRPTMFALATGERGK